MKICFVANATSIHNKRWASWFAQNGHDVHIVSFWDAEIKGVTVHYIKLLPSILTSLKNSVFQRKSLALLGKDTPPEKALKGFRSTLMTYFSFISQPLDNWRIKRTIQRIKPDILHGHYVTNYGFHAASSGFHPLVISAWGSDVLVDPGLSRFNRHRVKFALEEADLVTSESNYTRSATIELGASSQSNYIIQMGVDTDIFKPLPKASLKKELGIAGDDPSVISTRGFKPIYNYETIIRAIPYVLEESPNAKFVLCGSGSDSKTMLQSIANELGVAPSIRFVDEVAHDEVPEYLNMADLYISIPYSDSISIALLEAMACSLPVIVSDLPTNRELVRNDWNGYIVSLNSPQQLGRAIIRLLQNKETRKLFGKRNRTLVREKAEYNKNMKKMGELYQELVRRSKR